MGSKYIVKLHDLKRVVESLSFEIKEIKEKRRIFKKIFFSFPIGTDKT